MPELKYFLVSESLSEDQTTDHVSLFNILEELTVQLPMLMGRLVATSSWSIPPEERGRDFQVTLRIRRPSGEVLKEAGDIAINFTAEESRERTHHDIRNLPIGEPGDWTFELLLNGEQKATHVVAVRVQEAPA